jgi:hypothetical protein
MLQLSKYIEWLKLSFIISLLLPFVAFSQTYVWKKVAPFPYYLAEHTIYGNSTYFVYGRIIDSLSESTGKKKEIGTTPFFMTSIDGTTWKRVTPKAVYKDDNTATREENIIPLKTLFFNDAYIALARNGKNEKAIYRSKDGVTWYPTGIAASSFHFIRDRLIAEKDLTFSVSEDGKQWNTYGAVYADNPNRTKKIKKKFRTVFITSIDPSTVSFNGDSTRGYYADSCYVLTDNDRTVALSPDGVQWRVVERPIFRNDILIDDVIGYAYGNKYFVYVTSPEESEGVIHISGDGKQWKKITIDTVELVEKYGEYLPPTRYRLFFVHDSVFYLNRNCNLENSHTGGIVPIVVQYISGDGVTWKMHEDSKGRWITKPYPEEELPGETNLEKIDSVLVHRFRVGPTGTREPLYRGFFGQILFHDKRFIIPVDSKIMYQSRDGYKWEMVPRDIDNAVLLESDQYFKETGVFVEFYTGKVGFEDHKPIMTAKDEELYETAPRTGYVRISKDRKNWDTVFVDSLISKSTYSPILKKYSDGIIIPTYNTGCWYSHDAQTWKKLNVASSKVDSCRAWASFSAKGDKHNLYIFPKGITRLSSINGKQWFDVNNNCYNAISIAWGNGHFVACGENGNIWVLEEYK